MSGLERIKINSNYGMIKGRIGEAIAEQLFNELGYRVFRYGIENTLPGVVDIIEGDRGTVIKSIRNQPDFIVSSKQNDWSLIEVKYRTKFYILPR